MKAMDLYNKSSESPSSTKKPIQSLKYLNLSFVANSESSAHVITPRGKEYVFRNNQQRDDMPTKILPAKLSSDPDDDSEDEFKEITLHEMGFKTNDIENWESMNQPPKQDLYMLLKNMINNFIKPNVQVRVGDKTFNCHMMVLQCYSDFFMEFTNEVSVELPAQVVTARSFMMVYDWMLSAMPLVQREGILELFTAAKFLKVKTLVEQCWVCLDDDIRFREDTAFLLYLEARSFGQDMLQQLMLPRICKFFLTLVASKDFLLLSAKEVCNLLSSNSIGVNSEAEILMSATRWLSYNWKERKSEMLNVLKCVRFGLVPTLMLVAWGRETDCVELSRIVEHPEVKTMIEDGLSYATTKNFSPNNTDFMAFLERYKLTEPAQRQWIWDYQCGYHHNFNCPYQQNITYHAFCEYLDMIRGDGKDHWKKVTMASEKGKTIQCCPI